MRLVRCALLPALLGLSGPALPGNLPVPDASAKVRTEARIASIDAQLRASDSATLTLEKWCAENHMAEPARIVVQRDAGAERPASASGRKRLSISASEPVRYRRVRLVCGSHVLSEAENWYVPARLEPAMNAALDGSDEPFGKVVRPLQPTRRTLTNRRTWTAAASAMDCDGTAFTHEALVLDGKGRPLALVIENYKLELVCGIGNAADR